MIKKVREAFIFCIIVSFFSLSIKASEHRAVALQGSVTFEYLRRQEPIAPIEPIAPVKPTLPRYEEPVKPYWNSNRLATEAVKKVYEDLEAQYQEKQHFYQQAMAIAQKKYETDIAVWEILQKQYEERKAAYDKSLNVYVAVKRLYDGQISRLTQ